MRRILLLSSIPVAVAAIATGLVIFANCTPAAAFSAESPPPSSSASNEGYYRFPAVHGKTIVFTAEGDLWKVGIEGGVAQRMTTHHGVESNASISPDGGTIAFSAQYEGPTEVYTIPFAGGIPERRTFEGGTALVRGWSPGGAIIYSTLKHSTLPNTQLAKIEPGEKDPSMIPLAQAASGAFDPSGKTLFFTRLPFQGSHTKRYKGGSAENIWKFTEGSKEALPLTSDYAGTSKDPMWWEGRIYFLSDRDGSMNIWSMKEDGSDARQHTFHTGLDASSPSLSEGRIVYQLVADLYVYDIAAGAAKLLPVTLASDFDQARERWVRNPSDFITSVHLSPDGDRVALTARGQVFIAPVKEGRLVQATRKDGVRYRSARFMPDGGSLILLTDESGELEFATVPANGVGEEKALTSDGGVLRYEVLPSPDGKLAAFTDKNQDLWILDIEKGKTKKIASSNTSNFHHIGWAPDSRWLSFVQEASNTYPQIKIFSVGGGETKTVTSDRVDSYNPVWSPDGKWLYFLSDREFNNLVPTPWGSRQPEPFFDRTTKIYMTSLVPGERSPFLADDEAYLAAKKQKESGQKDEKADKGKEKGEKEEKAEVEVSIDFEGICGRVLEVPVPAGSYSSLSVNDKALFWIETETSPKTVRTLKGAAIGNSGIEVKTLAEEITGYESSLEGGKLMILKGAEIYVIDAEASPPSDLGKCRVPLSDWSFTIDPRNEWRQIFTEAWRLERDYFYDPELHGVDYEKILERYLPYVDRVTDRYELGNLISHVVGELSTLHTFVFGGDLRTAPDQISQGSLGAVFERGKKGFKIAHIYRSDPDYPERRPPLARPEAGIAEGDVITAINGIGVLDAGGPAPLLKNQAGRQVLLSLIRATDGKAYDAVVTPITEAAENDLRYGEWEYERRLTVERDGNGEIGYVHLRAMGGSDYSDWVRNFYPVFNRKGLIIDVRNNRGGNIDSWILEKLLRKAWFYWQPRIGEPFWNMQYAFRGHIAVLCNEHTASDGEAFAEGFRRLGLGKIIGTRSWGGEVWLSVAKNLVDLGAATAAELGVYGPEGEWLIEGHGVDPDIVIDNLPHETFLGRDAQLEAAIKHLKEKIEKEPVEVPEAPKYPDKSFKL